MMTFAQCLCHHTSGQEESTSPSACTQESMNLVFSNQDDEDAIYPLTTYKKSQKHKSMTVNSTQSRLNMVIPHS
jgi:hypothetical protein